MVSRTFILPVISPFRLDLTAWALRRRNINIIDQWDGKCYSRIFVFNNNPVKVTLIQEGTGTEQKVNITLQSEQYITPQIQKEVRSLIHQMFGIAIVLQPFYLLANTNDILKSLVEQFKGVKPPRFPTIFEALINSIACQQVTLSLGILILNRLSENFGVQFIENNNISYAFPRPEDLIEVSEEEIKKLGFSYQKARAIKELATAVFTKKIELTNLENMTNAEVVTYLSTIRGIGRWSAEYVLL